MKQVGIAHRDPTLHCIHNGKRRSFRAITIAFSPFPWTFIFPPLLG